MIPYVLAVLAMVVVSRSSDRVLERRYHVAIPVCVAGVALMGLGISAPVLVSLILLPLVVAGGFSSNGPFWSMPSEFLTGFSAAAGIALINSVANLGGFIGPFAIGLTARTGSLLAALGLASFSLFVSGALALLLPRELGRHGPRQVPIAACCRNVTAYASERITGKQEIEVQPSLTASTRFHSSVRRANSASRCSK